MDIRTDESDCDLSIQTRELLLDQAHLMTASTTSNNHKSMQATALKGDPRTIATFTTTSAAPWNVAEY
jgi:hypothetical protein